MITNYNEYKKFIENKDLKTLEELELHPDNFKEVRCIVGYYMGRNLYKSGKIIVNNVKYTNDNYTVFESDDGTLRFSIGTLFDFICMRGNFIKVA